MILITGGERSGKSTYAMRIALERGTRRAFVATAEPFDDEMRARIKRHRDERGSLFEKSLSTSPPSFAAAHPMTSC
jgi:adenosyl cobinamide kinase/adenosyl cobinamide phosphate guanylyltransferase